MLDSLTDGHGKFDIRHGSCGVNVTRQGGISFPTVPTDFEETGTNFILILFSVGVSTCANALG